MTESISKSFPNIIQSIGIAGFCLFIMILLIPVNLGLNNLIGIEASILITSFLSVGIPFGIVYMVRKNKTNQKGFNFSIHNKRIIPLTLFGAITLIFGIILPLQSLIPIPDRMAKLFVNMGSQIGFWGFVQIIIATPILEELLFRGIMLDGLLKKYSPLKSILVSSLLFGLIHLDPWNFFNVFALGLFSGWIYYKTKSMMPSIIIHATINFCFFIKKMFFNVDPINKNMVEIYGGITIFAFIILGSLFLFSISILCLKKEFIRK